MYLENKDKKTCSGCSACMNVCPKNAIQMVEDEEGFKYPQIDKTKCIDCKACFKICPNVEKNENEILEVYGVKHKDLNERLTSRSGGVFTALSDYVLSKEESSVYGVVLNKDYSASHKKANNKEEAFAFKGSKYIQSDMNYIIRDLKNDLLDNKTVLFSGTACQVAAVDKLINKSLQEKLITVDIICHGVPSKKVFLDYLDYIEKTENKKIKEFIFRDKSFGWHTHYETFLFEDGTKKSLQYFKTMFYDHTILRPSCHVCNYANSHRPADITIADFWGIENIKSEFDDNKGVSLVIINTLKGKKIFNEIKKDLDYFNVSIEDCMKYTYTLNKPTPASERREKFWEDYKNESFKEILEKYAQ